MGSTGLGGFENGVDDTFFQEEFLKKEREKNNVIDALNMIDDIFEKQMEVVEKVVKNIGVVADVAFGDSVRDITNSISEMVKSHINGTNFDEIVAKAKERVEDAKEVYAKKAADVVDISKMAVDDTMKTVNKVYGEDNALNKLRQITNAVKEANKQHVEAAGKATGNKNVAFASNINS